MTILRIWRGFTTPEKADAYETLLRTTHFPNIAAKRIPGFRRIELVKRREGDRVEVRTLMWFDSLDAVKAYAGPDYERAVLAPTAEDLLTEPDAFVSHFEVAVGVDSLD